MIAQLIFAHGAGNGSDSEFMQQTKRLFAEYQIDCHLFDFDYMQTMRETGKRRPPDKMDKLQARYLAEIEQTKTELPLFIGGKSMGGRVSTLILEQSDALSAICFGYPFHPPGKPDKTRTEHLMTMTKPVFIAQGVKDTFGKQQEVEGYGLPDTVTCEFLTDGDHSFKTNKRSEISSEQNLSMAVEKSAQHIANIISSAGE